MTVWHTVLIMYYWHLHARALKMRENNNNFTNYKEKNIIIVLLE